VIAEISTNHNQGFNIAIETIKAVKETNLLSFPHLRKLCGREVNG
jgi:hypothetical protein